MHNALSSPSTPAVSGSAIRRAAIEEIWRGRRQKQRKEELLERMVVACAKHAQLWWCRSDIAAFSVVEEAILVLTFW